MIFGRDFDKSYFLLVLPVLRMTLPWLQYRLRAIFILPFILLWCVCMLAKPIRSPIPGSATLRKYFLGTAVLHMMYKLLPLSHGLVGSYGRFSFNLYGFLSDIVMNLALLLVVYMSFVNQKFKELKFLGLVIIGGLLFTGAMTFQYGSEIEEGAARLIVASHNGLAADTLKVSDAQDLIVEAGLAGYAFMYIYAFLAPAFFYAAYKVRTKAAKILFLLVGCANVFCIKEGGLQTPVIVLLLGMCLMLIAVLFRLRSSLILFGIISAVLLFVFAVKPQAFSIVELPVRWCADMVEREVYKARLESIADAVSKSSLGAYVTERYARQKMSFDGFWSQYFLFGGGLKTKNGGHSEILDLMSAYGLMGLSVLVLYFICYKNFYDQLSKMYLGRQWQPMVLVYLGAYCFAGIANPIPTGSGQLYIVFPVLAMYFPDSPVGRYLAATNRGGLL